MAKRAFRIDGLQYNNWSPEIFQQMKVGGVDAVHVWMIELLCADWILPQGISYCFGFFVFWFWQH